MAAAAATLACGGLRGQHRRRSQQRHDGTVHPNDCRNRRAPTPGALTPRRTDTPITIAAATQAFTATLNDSKVVQDFREMPPSPCRGSATRASGTSPSSTPPLAETGPFYTDVQPGDLVYYNPLDSITIIYARTSSVPTLTKMGAITSNLNAFESLPDNVDMRIEARWQRRI